LNDALRLALACGRNVVASPRGIRAKDYKPKAAIPAQSAEPASAQDHASPLTVRVLAA